MFSKTKCTICESTDFYVYSQRFEDWRWADISAQKLIRRNVLSVATKPSIGDEAPPIAIVL